MRIDKENEVVWCSEWLIERLERANFINKNNLGKVEILSAQTLSSHVPESHEDDKWKELIDAIYNNYTFELEQSQKYYWRKKSEYLASFEDEQYLLVDENERTTVTSLAYANKLGEIELINFIGSVDFDKFEKVECE